MELIVPVDSAPLYATAFTSSTNVSSTSPICDDRAGKQISMRLLMLRGEIGSIIGKNGESINTYREKSGAKIKISEKGIGERIISIYGETQDVILVCKLFCRKLEWDARHKRKPTEPYFNNIRITPKIILRTLFPSSICGYILGKEGLNVRRIRQETGCLLTFSPNKLPNSTERILFISGDAMAVCDAAERICKCIASVKSKVPVIPYYPSSSLRKPQVLTSNNSLDLGKISDVRNCNIIQQLAEPEAAECSIKSRLKDKRKLGCSLLAASPRAQIWPRVESGEQADKGNKNLHKYPVHRKLLEGWNNSLTTTAPKFPDRRTSLAHPHSQTYVQISHGEETHAANRLNFHLPPPLTETSLNVQDAHLPFHFNALDVATESLAKVGPLCLDKAVDAALQRSFIRELTYEMIVPNELVGCIIGRGGLKINEIRRVRMKSFIVLTQCTLMAFEIIF
uniref:Poly(RC)-binding protein 4 n=1 Tax=Schistocephalus solidus TaxID=70667 RepID=A0A0X3NIZ2_SCHSO